MARRRTGRRGRARPAEASPRTPAKRAAAGASAPAARTRDDPWSNPRLRTAALAAPPLLFALLWWLCHDPRPSPAGDNIVYLLLARALAEGRGLTEIYLPAAAPHTRYPAAFPALLTPVYAVTGGDLGALKIFIGAIGAAAVALAQRWMRGREGDLVAFAGALAIASSPLLLQYADDTFTEVPFLAVTLVSLLLWERSDAGRRTAFFAGALAAALLAVLVRLVGIALPLAYGIALLRTRRRARAAAAMAVACAGLAAWAPSLVSGGGYGDELAARYELADSTAAARRPPGAERRNLAEHFVSQLETNGRILFIHAPIAQVLLPWTRDVGFARILAGLVTLAAILLYWTPRARRDPADPVPAYLLLTAGVLFGWVGPAARFLLPLLPFLLVAVLGLARRRGGGAAFALTAAILVVSALGGALTRATTAADTRAALARGNEAAGLAPASAQLRRAARWTALGLPAGTVVAARKPQLVFHYGGRPGLPYPRTRDPRDFARRLAESGADVLLADRETAAAARYLAPFVVAYAAKLPLLYETGDPANTVVLGLAPLREPGGLEPAERPSTWPPPTRLPVRNPGG